VVIGSLKNGTGEKGLGFKVPIEKFLKAKRFSQELSYNLALKGGNLKRTTFWPRRNV